MRISFAYIDVETFYYAASPGSPAKRVCHAILDNKEELVKDPLDQPSNMNEDENDMLRKPKSRSKGNPMPLDDASQVKKRRNRVIRF